MASDRQMSEDEDSPTSGDDDAGVGVAGKAPAKDASYARRLVERAKAGTRKVRGYPLPVRLGGIAAVLLVIAAGAWLVLRSPTTDPSPEPMTAIETSNAFFDARQDGDCERLLDLISEASWSDGGARSGEEFLEQCAEALEGFEPYTPGHTYHYVGDDGEHLDVGDVNDPDAESDHVVVWLMTGRTEDPHFQYTGEGTDHRRDDEEDQPEGRLVQEDGDWRVVTDEAVFHIGPAVHEMIPNYVQAWSQGDCEGLLSYVSEDVWSAGGERTHAQFVERCSDAAEGRQPLESGNISSVDASFSDDGRASATVSFFDAVGDEDETATLVREGLRWKFDHNEDLSAGVAPGTYFNELRYQELERQLLDQVSAGNETCSDHTDEEGSEADEGEEALVVIRREFCSFTGAHVTVLEQADAPEASSAAEQMAQELLDEAIPEVQEGTERERRPNQRADVPGMPEAFAVRTNCDPEGCFTLNAFMAHGHMVVKVEVSLLSDFEGSNMNDVAQILAEQRDRLALY